MFHVAVLKQKTKDMFMVVWAMVYLGLMTYM